MREERYPKNATEFDAWFPDEAACLRYLAEVRWPDGFQCPGCTGLGGWEVDPGLFECRACGRQTSARSGTVLHRSRRPLRQWFQAMWWVATQKTGGSAKGLQRLLGLGSYQTAWAWLHKLRRGMVRAGREPLEGPVEVDEAYIGGEEPGVTGRQTYKKAKVAVAVEIPSESRSQSGRVRFQVVKDFSAESLCPFVTGTVVKGARVITDGWESYGTLGAKGFVHEVRNLGGDRKAAAKLLPNVHRAISLLKRWLAGTHQGAVRPHRLQHYLDEFAFRHNRRKSQHVGKVFYRLVQGACQTTPHPYWKLVGRSAPNKPLRMGPRQTNLT